MKTDRSRISAANFLLISIFVCFYLQILAMDINRENYEIGLPIIEKAGLAHKIEFREGPALPALDLMVEDVSSYYLCRYLPRDHKFCYTSGKEKCTTVTWLMVHIF